MRPIIIRFRHEHARGTIQVAVIRRGWILKFLRGGNPMLLQHEHQQFCFNHRPGEKKFHAKS